MTWPLWLRIGLYLIGLLYSFVAVFIVADIFMCSIDSITSTTRQVRMSLYLLTALWKPNVVKVTISGENGEDEVIDVPIWNGTVANIVLMSLGNHQQIVNQRLSSEFQVPDQLQKYCSPSSGFCSMISSRTSLVQVLLLGQELSTSSSSPPSAWPSSLPGRPGGYRPILSSSSPWSSLSSLTSGSSSFFWSSVQTEWRLDLVTL